MFHLIELPNDFVESDKIEPYRAGRYGRGDLTAWFDILSHNEGSLKKKLSALGGLGGILHSKSQPEKSKRDAFQTMLNFVTTESQFDSVFSFASLDYFAEFLILSNEEISHSAREGWK